MWNEHDLKQMESKGITTAQIDKQLERAAITCIAGFAKIFKDASKVLTV